MKRIVYITIAVISIFAASVAMAARQNARTLSGRVLDENSAPIELATVVALAPDSTQRAGAATDNKGRFSLAVGSGEYIIAVQYLGYRTFYRNLSIVSDLDLGDIVLQPSATSVGDVVVTARLVTRESDRFVVDVANNPAAAIGKDGVEMLKSSPGVWIDGDKISVNGSSGTRVMVNERMLNLSGDDLIAYLRAINAEEIQKIEIIPISGADYDADSTGGIIKITLKKQRRDGIDGSLQTRYITSKYNPFYMAPSARINYHTGRTTLNAALRYSYDDFKTTASETTEYFTSDNQLNGESFEREWANRWSATLGGVVEIDDRQSIGLEANASFTGSKSRNNSLSQFISRQLTVNNTSLYRSVDGRDFWSATGNYILKLDTLGSTFKVIGDFFSRTSNNDRDYFNRAITGTQSIDSTYRSAIASDYKIYALSLALDKKLSSVTSLRAGAKYTRNNMDNGTMYEYLAGGSDWTYYAPQSVDIDFSENIGALYGIVSTKLGKVGITAGLRAEYTYAAPRTHGGASEDTYAKQSYLSLFPNANISLPLNKDQSTSLIFSYSRTIGRPLFWQLSPYRQQISEYAYTVGNPKLKPTYTNSFNLTAVFNYKYSLTIGANFDQNPIQQLAQVSSEDDGNRLMYRHENLDSQWFYFIAANLPLQPTKWLSINLNATGLRVEQRIDASSTDEAMYVGQCNASLNVKLPLGFYLEAYYWFRSPIKIGNLKQETTNHSLSLAVKKSFAKDRFTINAGVNNIVNSENCISATQPEFRRWTNMRHQGTVPAFTLSLRYNFHSGVKFRSRSVESGAESESSRMN